MPYKKCLVCSKNNKTSRNVEFLLCTSEILSSLHLSVGDKVLYNTLNLVRAETTLVFNYCQSSSKNLSFEYFFSRPKFENTKKIVWNFVKHKILISWQVRQFYVAIWGCLIWLLPLPSTPSIEIYLYFSIVWACLFVIFRSFDFAGSIYMWKSLRRWLFW